MAGRSGTQRPNGDSMLSGQTSVHVATCTGNRVANLPSDRTAT